MYANKIKKSGFWIYYNRCRIQKMLVDLDWKTGEINFDRAAYLAYNKYDE